MPRVLHPVRKIKRVVFLMNEEVTEQIESLMMRTKADSRAEVMRKALALYDYLWTTQENKDRTFVVKEGEETKEVVLL